MITAVIIIKLMNMNKQISKKPLHKLQLFLEKNSFKVPRLNKMELIMPPDNYPSLLKSQQMSTERQNKSIMENAQITPKFFCKEE